MSQRYFKTGWMIYINKDSYTPMLISELIYLRLECPLLSRVKNYDKKIQTRFCSVSVGLSARTK